MSNLVKSWQELRDECVIKDKMKPGTARHEAYINAIETHTLTLCTGPAGTGKSHWAISKALEMLLDSQRPIDKVIITRPMVECGGTMGFQPGNSGEKFSPFTRPMLDLIRLFIEDRKYRELVELKKIEFLPLNFLKGITFKRTFVVADEMQDASLSQVKTLLTRIGSNSRFVICADIKQSDIVFGEGKLPPIYSIIKKIRHLDDVRHVVLTKDDIMRHGLVREILEILEE